MRSKGTASCPKGVTKVQWKLSVSVNLSLNKTSFWPNLRNQIKSGEMRSFRNGHEKIRD